MSNTEKIRELNDILRKTGKGGKVVTTAGVAALGAEATLELMQHIRAFDGFTPDNDPHGEHDFGEVGVAGQKFFFKVDCYDKDFKNGSEDPANALITNRVLTIMLASEY